MVSQNIKAQISCGLLLALIIGLSTGCARKHAVHQVIETTAYCGCAKCCNWERGNTKYLKLDFWNRYTRGKSGRKRLYNGKTASGTTPRQAQPGLFSTSSARHPESIPGRILPWRILPGTGTIAADTRYYPFGTRMYIPGYGWGVVEDRGGAIKGRHRIDLYFNSHKQALQWGRRKVPVTIEYP